MTATPGDVGVPGRDDLRHDYSEFGRHVQLHARQHSSTGPELGLGETITDTIPYTTSDGALSDNGQLVITIIGVNDPPVANPNVDTIGKGGAQSGQR